MSTCEHRIRHEARCSVSFLEDSGDFRVDVKINCADCGMPFRFAGLRCGYHPRVPSCSVAGEEARMPIQPLDLDGPLPAHLQDLVVAPSKQSSEEAKPACDPHAAAETNQFLAQVDANVAKAIQKYWPALASGNAAWIDAAYAEWLEKVPSGLVAGMIGHSALLKEIIAKHAGHAPVDRSVPVKALNKTEKKPRLFYYESALDGWTFAPGLLEQILSIEQFSFDGETQEIEFKRVDLTDQECADLPEL